MKIPRKTELLRLQALYKTDAKIAEALGGIPEYLVAYWRRKKRIPRHTAAKFTQQQITELWERFGDDFRCGRELNISKAAFYSWRRKYGLLEKPAVLKLEQLELLLSGGDGASDDDHGTTSRTASQKIRDRCRDTWPTARIPADWTAAAKSGDPAGVFSLSPGPGHTFPDSAPVYDPRTPLRAHITGPEWVYAARGAVAWQLVESRAVVPGQCLAGARREFGGLGGIGVLVTDPSSDPKDGRTIRIELTRRLSGQIDVEEVFLTLLAHDWSADWSGAVVEFLGGPIERLSVDRKFKLCELTVGTGAQAALCPFDDLTRRHFGRVIYGKYPQAHPDRTANYDGEHFLEGRNVEVLCGVLNDGVVSGANAFSAHTAQVVIVGPSALPYEIETIAEVLEDRLLARPDCLIVCPATLEVERLSQRRGWTQTIISAGGLVLPAAATHRLGHDGLIAMCGESVSAGVIATGLLHPTAQHAGLPISLAGVRSAVQHGLEFVA